MLIHHWSVWMVLFFKWWVKWFVWREETLTCRQTSSGLKYHEIWEFWPVGEYLNVEGEVFCLVPWGWAREKKTILRRKHLNAKCETTSFGTSQKPIATCPIGDVFLIHLIEVNNIEHMQTMCKMICKSISRDLTCNVCTIREHSTFPLPCCCRSLAPKLKRSNYSSLPCMLHLEAALRATFLALVWWRFKQLVASIRLSMKIS